MKATAQPLRVQLIPVAVPDALRSWNSALDLLADWMAKDLLEESRQETAAQLGVSPDDIAAAPNDTAEAARAHGERLLGTSS